MLQIKNISEVTEPLKEDILKGDVHTIEEMKAWLQSFGYSDAINDAAINFILREFVMSKVSTDSMMNADMVVELLRPQLEITKEDIRSTNGLFVPDEFRCYTLNFADPIFERIFREEKGKNLDQKM